MRMAYIAFIPGLVKPEEMSLIEDLLAFEGIYYFKLDIKDERFKPYVLQYYKGGRPVIIITNEFIDVPTSRPREVLVGFWGLVGWFNKTGMIRC